MTLHSHVFAVLPCVTCLASMACGSAQIQTPSPAPVVAEPEREVPTAEAPAPSSPPGQAPAPPADTGPASDEPAKADDKPAGDDEKPATSSADLTDDESDYGASR
jgi:hypothetical protein